MSHYLDMKTAMTDPEALVRALIHVGFRTSEVKIHSKPTTIMDYCDQPTDKKAIVIVDRYGAKRLNDYPSNDIGFYKAADGTLKVHMDDGFLERQPNFMERLGTFYNYEKSKMELDARKAKYIEQTDKLGRLQLRVIFKTKQKKAQGIRL